MFVIQIENETTCTLTWLDTVWEMHVSLVYNIENELYYVLENTNDSYKI
jgi:hypothetical protein